VIYPQAIEETKNEETTHLETDSTKMVELSIDSRKIAKEEMNLVLE